MMNPQTNPAGDTAASLTQQLNQPIGVSANLLRGLRSRLVRRGAGLEADEVAALDRAIDQMALASRVIGRLRELTHAAARCQTLKSSLLQSSRGR